MKDDQIKKIIADKTPIDRILEITNYGGYAEVIGTAGGDTLTYRIYGNGTVTER